MLVYSVLFLCLLQRSLEDIYKLQSCMCLALQYNFIKEGIQRRFNAQTQLSCPGQLLDRIAHVAIYSYGYPATSYIYSWQAPTCARQTYAIHCPDSSHTSTIAQCSPLNRLWARVAQPARIPLCMLLKNRYHQRNPSQVKSSKCSLRSNPCIYTVKSSRGQIPLFRKGQILSDIYMRW